jgi:Transposase DDE domain
MTPRQSAKVCVPATSCLGSPSETLSTASGLGRSRWVVERTFAWLNQFRRLRVRYEKRADIHEAFLALACALLCWNVLQRHHAGSDWVGPRLSLASGAEVILISLRPWQECSTLEFDAKNCTREASNSSIYLQAFTREILCGTPQVVSYKQQSGWHWRWSVARLNPTRHPAPFPTLPEPPLLAIIIRLWPCHGAVG